MPDLAETIKQRYARARHERDWLESDLQDAYELCMPHYCWDGQKRRNLTHTDVGREALDAFVTEAMKTVTPIVGGWGKFAPGEEILLQGPQAEAEVERQLEPLNDLVFRTFERSNLYVELPRAFMDRAVSTGILMVHATGEPLTPIRFEAVPLWQVTIEAGPMGSVGGVYRCFEWTMEEIEARYPDANLSALASQKTTDGSKFRILEACITPEGEPHSSNRKEVIVISLDGDAVLLRRVYGFNPWIAFRGPLPAGSALGRGPGLRMLNDIRQHNAMEACKTKYMGRVTDPFYKIDIDDASSIDSAILEPGALIPTTRPDSFMPMPLAGNINFTQFGIEELADRIMRGFRTLSLPDPSDGIRTLGELQIRREADLDQLEPAASRYETELIQPLLQATLAILQSNGTVPRNFKADGRIVTIKVSGPLAQLRRQVEALAKVNAIGTIAREVGPSALIGTMDVTGQIAEVLPDMGIDPEFILTDEERAQAQQQIQQQQQVPA